MLNRAITILVLFFIVVQTTAASCLHPDSCYVAQEMGMKKNIESDEDSKDKKIFASNALKFIIALSPQMDFDSTEVAIISTTHGNLLYPPPDLEIRS